MPNNKFTAQDITRIESNPSGAAQLEKEINKTNDILTKIDNF